MKNKKLLIATSFFVSVAAILAAVTFITKDLRRLNSKIDFQLEDNARKIKVLYKNKEKTEAANVDLKKLEFTEYDNTKYDIDVMDVKPMKNKLNSVRVRFTLKNKFLNLVSELMTSEISGFKMPGEVKLETKEDLDNLLDKINEITYDGDKSKTTFFDVDTSKMTFVDLPENAEVVLVSIDEKPSDRTTTIVTFRIKAKNSDTESEIKSIEIHGFQKPDKQRELDFIANNVVIDWEHEIGNLVIEEDKDKIIPIFKGYDKEKYDLVNKKLSPIPGINSDLEVKYQLKSKLDDMLSEEVTQKITGFRVRKTSKELDEISQNIRVAVDNDLRQLILAKNLDQIDVNFLGYDKELYTIEDITKTIKNEDDPILAINFKIREVDGIVKSDVWVIDIYGDEKSKTLKELNEAINNVDVEYNSDNKENTVIDEISDVKQFVFSNLEKDNFNVSDVSFNTNDEDSSILEVKFKIEDKNSGLKSNERTVKIPGFKARRTLEEINKLAENVKVSVDDEFKSTPLDVNLVNIEPIFSDYDKNIFDITDIKKTQSETDQSVLIVNFVLKEKARNIKSDIKSVEVNGFRVWKTKEQLNEINLLATTEIDEEFKKYSLSEKIDEISPIFKGFDQKLYEIETKKLQPKKDNPDILLVKIQIKEKGGKIISDERTLEIPGFKVWKTLTELNNLVDGVTVKFDGDKEQFFASEAESSNKIIFENFDEEAYDIVEKGFKTSDLDPSKLEVSFKLREKFRDLNSYVKKVEITGFKTLKTKEELTSIIKDVVVSFEGSAEKTLLPNNLNDLNINYGDLDTTIFEIVDKDVKVKPEEETTVIVKFKIKEKEGSAISDEKTAELPGFRVLKTKEELDNITNPLSVTYSGVKNITSFDDIKLDEIDLNYSGTDEYEIVDKEVSEKPGDKTTALVKFKIKEKDGEILSGVKSLEITGFKVLKTLDELNEIANDVNATFEGDKNAERPNDLNSMEINLSGYDIDKYEIINKNIIEKPGDKSTIQVKFKIKEKDSLSSSIERTIEIPGFKVWKTADELEKEMDKMTVAFEGIKNNVVISENKDKLKVNFYNLDKENYEVVDLTMEENPNNKSVLKVTYKIKEKDGTITSPKRSANIPGFKVWKTIEELDEVSNNINATFTGDVKTTVIPEDPQTMDINLSNLDVKDYVIVEKSITAKPGDKSSVLVKFKLKEKGGRIITEEKTIEIPGFKVWKTSEELYNILDSVTATFNGNKKSTVISENIDTISVDINGVDESVYEIVEKEIKEKPRKKSVLQVKFKIKEKDGTTLSKIKTIEIPGFKVRKTKEELNNIIKSMSAEYVGDKSMGIPKEKMNVKFNIGLSNNNIEEIGKKVILNPKDKSTLKIVFKIKEKDGTIESDEKSIDITGFKVWKTSKELDKILEPVTATFGGDKNSTVISEDLSKLEIDINGIDESIYDIVKEVKEKPEDKSTLLVTIKIKEKNSEILSKIKTIEIPGFKVRKTEDELNKIAKSANAEFVGDKKLGIPESKDSIQVNINNIDETNYDIVEKEFTVKPDDQSTLLVKFKVKEKGGTVSSEINTIEIPNFNFTRNKDELDKISEAVEMSVDGDKSKIVIEGNEDSIEIKHVNLDNDNFEIVEKSVSAKPDDKSILLVNYKIKQKGGTIVSEVRTIEIPGFKVWKVTETMNELAKKVQPTFTGDKTSVILEETPSENIKLNYTGYNEDKYEIVEVSKKPSKTEKDTLEVSYKIREKDGNLLSDEVTSLISGFKTRKTRDDLDKVNVVVSIDESLRKNKLPEIIDKVQPTFDGYDKDAFEIVEAVKRIHPRKPDTLVVGFRIKEKNGDVTSREKSQEFPYFVVPISKDGLERTMRKVTAVVVPDSNGKIDPDYKKWNVHFKGLDLNTYEMLDIEIVKAIDSYTGYRVGYIIKQKGEKIVTEKKYMMLSLPESPQPKPKPQPKPQPKEVKWSKSVLNNFAKKYELKYNKIWAKDHKKAEGLILDMGTGNPNVVFTDLVVHSDPKNSKNLRIIYRFRSYHSDIKSDEQEKIFNPQGKLIKG